MTCMCRSVLQYIRSRVHVLMFILLFSKTAVFTPTYGSVTNVRINSLMTTPQVLRVLLNKFKIETSSDDFAIYLVHASGGECELFHSHLVKTWKSVFMIKTQLHSC